MPDLSGNVVAWYDQEIGLDKAGLIQGQYEQILRQSRTSHQFFNTDQWQKNNLIFRGQLYEGIPLIYDLERDLILIQHPTDFLYHAQPIKLPQEYVSQFSLYDHVFTYYKDGILSYGPGFFDELFAGGNFTLLAKRIKNPEPEETSIIYNATDKYLMAINGVFFKYNGRRTLMKSMKAYKSQLRTYISKNHIRTKASAENENNLYLIAEYCDQLLSTKQ